MNIPFVYGKIVSENDFTDRKKETEKLVANFLSQTNSAIISPRRWGKSSLVNRAVEAVRNIDDSILFVNINIFKCKSPQAFYELFAKKVVQGISPSPELLLANAREFVTNLLPRISISDPSGQYDISFGIDIRKNPIDESILDLPQQIAIKRNRKVVVCIDEFQQIGEFDESEQFQKILRSHWQEHSDVAYVLYGSKKHMMLGMFGEYNSPLYRFGDLMFLPKIANSDWVEYIMKRFTDTGKIIDKKTAGHLAELVDNHSYYVQQLAQYAWLRTEIMCDSQTVDMAFSSLMDSLSLQFVNLMDDLTEKQRNFLCAISDGVVNFSSAQTLSKYNLGTSANIRILKGAMKKKDIIDESQGRLSIQDPVFKTWIQQVYTRL